MNGKEILNLALAILAAAVAFKIGQKFGTGGGTTTA